MLEAAHYSAAGARHKSPFALPKEYFDGEVNEPVLHSAVRAFLNNQRQGNAATKSRSDVSGGELRLVLDASAAIKSRRRKGEIASERPLIGKVLGSGLRRERETGLKWLAGDR